MTATIGWVIGLSLVLWVTNYFYFHDYLSAKETSVLVAAVAVVVVGCQMLFRVASGKNDKSKSKNKKGKIKRNARE